MQPLVFIYIIVDMVHRDLKLENVLLSTADPEDMFNIKVGMCPYLCSCDMYNYDVHMYSCTCVHCVYI